MSQRVQYIGACDLQHKEHILAAAEFFESEANHVGLPEIKLMAGLMMSYKSMHGLSQKWGKVWVKPEEVKNVFINHPRVINCLHYADMEDQTQVVDILKAAEYGGPNMDAIQLDMPWPRLVLVKELRKKFPKLKIVLQVGRQAFDRCENDPLLVADELMFYIGHIDYVLLDKSMGEGKKLDPDFLRPFIEIIKKNFPEFGVAVGGGLDYSSSDLIRRIYEIDPNISCDAQAGLHENRDPLQPIDGLAVMSYLKSVLFTRAEFITTAK